MAQIKLIGECPNNKYIEIHRFHYHIVLENGLTYKICSNTTDELQLTMTVELLGVCISLFGNSTDGNCMDSEYMRNCYYFPDNSNVFVNYPYRYDYYNSNYSKSYNVIILFHMIDYLKKRYANLLLPVKVARSE